MTSTTLELTWADYSKSKYDLDKAITDNYEASDKDMSSLLASLAQSGTESTDPQYTLAVDKLLAEQATTQQELLDAREGLSSSSMLAVLNDPYYAGGFGDYVGKLVTNINQEAKAKFEREYIGTELPDYDYGGYEWYTPSTIDESVSFIKESTASGLTSGTGAILDIEKFYTSMFGSYTPSAEEISSAASSASMAQAAGVSGGQRSVSGLAPTTNPASIVGGNIFLGASDSSETYKWWN